MTSKHTQAQIIAAAMETFLAREAAEHQRRQAIREAVANGTYQQPEPCTWGWNISDRH